MSAETAARDDILVERDFLLSLVDLVDDDSPELLVARALRLIAARVGAERAHIQIGDVDDPHGPAWSAAFGFGTEERDAIRALLSTTIMREALAKNTLVESSSAATDPRFSGLASVQRNHIEAVLCLPIGSPGSGVLYLQAHASGLRFPPEAKAWAERFVRHLRPVVRRLLDAQRGPHHDATSGARAQLGGAAALVGKSPALAAMLRWAATVSERNLSVLISGAAGVGKSTLASIVATNGSSPAMISEDIERLSVAEQEALATTPGRIVATTRVPHDRVQLVDALRARLTATFEVPSLSVRRGDVPLLAEHFLTLARSEHGLRALALSPTAQQALLVAEWPGEVTQLAQVVVAAALRAHGDGLERIDPTCFFGRTSDVLGPRPIVAWQIAIRDCQRRTLKEALAVTQGNITEAARRLGIARSYAYELVRDLNLR